jgi:DNA-binding NarL/FixJ family response regulator
MYTMSNHPVTIHVLIVDDHPLFRNGLKGALDLVDDIAIVGISEDGEHALQIVNDLNPDVILLDVNLPGMNGLQVARQLRSTNDDIAVIILTAHHDREQVIHAMRTGAAAYCAKEIHAEALVQIIRDVANGYYFAGEKRMTQEELDLWLEDEIDDSTGPYTVDAEGHYIPLSPRETEILEQVTLGLINKEIASKLGISQQTVKNHMTSILKKLNVKDRTQAAVTALRRGWVRIDNDSQEET